MSNQKLVKILEEIKACRVCEDFLPLGPRPIVSAQKTARILIIGQAPGTKVHESGVPWDDQSGRRLRDWMGIEKEDFYDPKKVAIVPMGFCYPGRGKSGDLPPRPECEPLWHKRLLDQLPNISLTLLIGSYAQSHYLGLNKKKTLTDTVKAYQTYLPDYLPLVHPSPRNGIWLRKNEWFESDVIPVLKEKVKRLLMD